MSSLAWPEGWPWSARIAESLRDLARAVAWRQGERGGSITFPPARSALIERTQELGIEHPTEDQLVAIAGTINPQDVGSL